MSGQVEIGNARLPASFWARICLVGSCWVWTGARQSKGYGLIQRSKKRLLVHRLAFETLVGPAAGIVDHVCFVRLCCNPSHLRLASARASAEYRRGPSGGSSSFKGVSWEGRRNKWRASAAVGPIRADGRRSQRFLGYFEREEDAAKAYDAAVIGVFETPAPNFETWVADG